MKRKFTFARWMRVVLRPSSSLILHPSSFPGILCLLLASYAFAADAPKARVVVAHDPDAIQHFDVNPDRVKQLVDEGMRALTGKQQDADVWRQFASPKDVVGIKIVARGGPLFAVHKEIVAAIVDGLESAGVPENQIIVWDKYPGDLVDAGYKINESSQGIRVLGVIPDVGFDPEVIFHSPHAGKIIWGDYLFGRQQEEISSDSHVARILTQRITKLIDVAVLSDHYVMGVSGCLLNLAMDSVDNVRRFQDDVSDCQSAVAEICSLPVLRDKMVLHVMDGLLGQYASGPAFHPNYTWHNGSIYFSTDPVALDTVALEEIQVQRKRVGLPPIGAEADYITDSAEAGLGTTNVIRIAAGTVGKP